MTIKKMLTTAFLSLATSSAFADSSSGTVSGEHIHEKFTMVFMKGEAAKKIYDRIKTAENVDTDRIGRFTKISADGRMWCQKDVEQSSYQCAITFNTSSGEIYTTWAK